MQDRLIKTKNEFRKEEKVGVQRPTPGCAASGIGDSLGDWGQAHAPAIVISSSAGLSAAADYRCHDSLPRAEVTKK